jgi:hypothetical protein
LTPWWRLKRSEKPAGRKRIRVALDVFKARMQHPNIFTLNLSQHQKHLYTFYSSPDSLCTLALHQPHNRTTTNSTSREY